MDEKLLAEIKKTYSQLRLGYGHCNNQLYAKHVGPLLEAYEQLRKSLEVRAIAVEKALPEARAEGRI